MRSEMRPLTRFAEDESSDGSSSDLEVSWQQAAVCRPRPRHVLFAGIGLALLAVVVLAVLSSLESSPHEHALMAAHLPAVEQLNAAADTVENSGEDCWVPCGNVSGGCPSFCGPGNACCRFGALHDPPECIGVVHWPTKESHTCVKPVVPIVVEHAGQDCFKHCGNRSGGCSWCGKGNACCRAGLNDRVACSNVRFWPVVDKHTCVRPDLKPPGPVFLPPSPKKGPCSPGEVQDKQLGKCVRAALPTLMRFYMYKALSDEDYRMENTNLASITGVLMYLHDEVLTACPRKFGITRIVRYLVTMKNPLTVARRALPRQFGQFVQFDNGKCIANNSVCSPLWEAHGYVVGCMPLDTSNPNAANYDGPAPVMYSLPGKCPSMEYGQKTKECMSSQPGGQCSSPDGDVDCTWKAEPAGEIRIDDLARIADYNLFCKFGGMEYNPASDRGTGMDFWNGRRDAASCRERVARVRQLFQLKYPYWDVSLGDPPCDSI